ncbi:hypothetical protein ACTXGL_10260 [Psychrobacter sp. T6-6]|uniref:hypothetical protein n=1 Tax=Psychrobacter sp. T6-6 TaxID=3457452 RepID=UPI003FD1887A|tara:strand:+ start:243 stop:641 length:399 start_codon:yes stop_codon:yes gene_type:complete
MHNTFRRWLTELEDMVVICAEDIHQEAAQNIVSFGFNQDLLVEWSEDSVIEFISKCANLYHRKSGVSEMLFYAWFDEQAGQIRISAVSQSHKKLPFRCELNQVTLNELVNGIYADDSGLYTKGKLDIWQQKV